MANNRITLELEGLPTEGGYIRLPDFLGALQSLKSALTHADLLASGGKKTAYLRVVALSLASPARITVEAVPIGPVQDSRNEISDTVFAATRKEIDPIGSENGRLLIDAVQSMASMVGKGFAGVHLRNGNQDASLTPKLRLESRRRPLPSRASVGSVRGRLEAINLHAGANNFRIYPIVGPRKIVCRFLPDQMDLAIASVNEMVKVTGVRHFKENASFPFSIDVSNLEPLLPNDQLPKLSQLRGAAPHATGDMKSEDFVRQLRDAWQE
jgi:hypothetical protein